MARIRIAQAKVKLPGTGIYAVKARVKMSSRLSVPFMIKNLVHRNAVVVIFSAKHLPKSFPATKSMKGKYRQKRSQF
jgi:hypothetical protein